MRKFIVTADGHFKFGDVNMHKDLLSAGEDCIGGGIYEFDYVGGRMLLSGKSYDFGRVQWYSVDTLYLPESLRGLTLEYCDLPITDFVSSIAYYDL